MPGDGVDDSGVLPKGWYYLYVNDELGYCPTRVWGLDELPADDTAMIDLYEQGNRWVVVFSDATGPRGDRTFIHIDSFDAAAMRENQLREDEALREIADMGYQLRDLPDGITLGISAGHAQQHTAAEAPAAGPAAGWYPDPLRGSLCAGGMASIGRPTFRTGPARSTIRSSERAGARPEVVRPRCESELHAEGGNSYGTSGCTARPAPARVRLLRNTTRSGARHASNARERTTTADAAHIASTIREYRHRTEDPPVPNAY